MEKFTVSLRKNKLMFLFVYSHSLLSNFASLVKRETFVTKGATAPLGLMKSTIERAINRNEKRETKIAIVQLCTSCKSEFIPKQLVQKI